MSIVRTGRFNKFGWAKSQYHQNYFHVLDEVYQIRNGTLAHLLDFFAYTEQVLVLLIKNCSF